MIIERNGLSYEYVTYNNRWTIHGHAFIDNAISAFVAQDIKQEFKFVVTYQETVLDINAKVCVFQKGKTDKFISFGCVLVMSNPKLSDLVPDRCEYNELTEIQKRRYFVEGYIVEGYID